MTTVRYKVVMALACFLVSAPTLLAQSGEAGDQTRASARDKPERLAYLTYEIQRPDRQNRILRIYRDESSETAQSQTLLVYHQIPFFPVVNEVPIAGLPDIVHDYKESDEQFKVTLKFLLSDETICNGIRLYVESHAPSADVAGKTVKVEPYPLLAACVSMVDLADPRTVLAVSPDMTLTEANGELELTFVLDGPAFERFLELADSNALGFVAFYSSSSATVQRARSLFDAKVDYRVVLAKHLTSEQLDGTLPILQSQMNAVEKELHAATASAMDADSESVAMLLPNNSTQLTGLLCEPATLMTMSEVADAFSQGDEQSLSLFLSPLDVRTSSGETALDQEANRRTTGSDNSTTVGAGIAIGGETGGFNQKLGNTRSTSVRNIVEHMKSVAKNEYVEDMSRQSHLIKTYRLQQGWETKTLKQFAKVTLGVGLDASYKTMTPIPSTLTDKVLIESLSTAARNEHAESSRELGELLDRKNEAHHRISDILVGLATLRTERTNLEAEKTSRASALVANDKKIKELNAKRASLDKQIAKELQIVDKVGTKKTKARDMEVEEVASVTASYHRSYGHSSVWGFSAARWLAALKARLRLLGLEYERSNLKQQVSALNAQRPTILKRLEALPKEISTNASSIGRNESELAELQAQSARIDDDLRFHLHRFVGQERLLAD